MRRSVMSSLFAGAVAAPLAVLIPGSAAADPPTLSFVTDGNAVRWTYQGDTDPTSQTDCTVGVWTTPTPEIGNAVAIATDTLDGPESGALQFRLPLGNYYAGGSCTGDPTAADLVPVTIISTPPPGSDKVQIEFGQQDTGEVTVMQLGATNYTAECDVRLGQGPDFDPNSWLRRSSTLLKPGVEIYTTWEGGPGGVNTLYARCVDPVTDVVTDEIGPIRMGSGAGPSVDALTTFGS